jgi:hypothetical protein
MRTDGDEFWMNRRSFLNVVAAALLIMDTLLEYVSTFSAEYRRSTLRKSFARTPRNEHEPLQDWPILETESPQRKQKRDFRDEIRYSALFSDSPFPYLISDYTSSDCPLARCNTDYLLKLNLPSVPSADKAAEST